MSRVAALSFHLGLARQVQGEAKPDTVDVGYGGLLSLIMSWIPFLYTKPMCWDGRRTSVMEESV